MILLKNLMFLHSKCYIVYTAAGRSCTLCLEVGMHEEGSMIVIKFYELCCFHAAYLSML